MQFRKKPVVIEASQWHKNGDHPGDYAGDTQGLENGEMRAFTGAERKAIHATDCTDESKVDDVLIVDADQAEMSQIIEEMR